MRDLNKLNVVNHSSVNDAMIDRNGDRDVGCIYGY